MARSSKPSVWIEKRRSATGYITYRVRSEFRGSRLPDIACGPDRAQAVEVRDKLRTDLWAGKLGLLKRGEARTVGTYVEQHLEYRRAHKAVRTVAGFDAPALKSFAEHVGAELPLEDVAREHLEDWKLAQLASGLSPHTVGMRMRAVKSALSHAVRIGAIANNPAAGVSSPRGAPTGRVLLSSEIERLIQRLPYITARAVFFDVNCGLRLTELLELDWRQVRTDARPWTAEIRGKGDKLRLVHLNAKARSVMGVAAESGRVFAGLSADMIHSHLASAARTLKLGRVRFHDLRHTWATEYMRRTGDLPGLMLEGGWSTLAAVKAYQHLSRARAAAVELLDFGVSPPILPQNAGVEGRPGRIPRRRKGA